MYSVGDISPARSVAGLLLKWGRTVYGSRQAKASWSKYLSFPAPETLTIHYALTIYKTSQSPNNSQLSKNVRFDNEDGICQKKFYYGIFCTDLEQRLGSSQIISRSDHALSH